MSLMETILGQLGGDKMTEIGRQLNTDPQTASTVTSSALTTLLGALSKNAAEPQGAQALHQALERDHDGSVLDNLGGLLQNPDQGGGNGILKHVLGSRRQVVERSVGQATGVDSAGVGQVLAMLAPVVLGALGRQQREQKLSSTDLGGMLGRERQEFESRQPQAAGLLGKLLDQDGDGDVDLGDVLKGGSGLLGNLFNK